MTRRYNALPWQVRAAWEGTFCLACVAVICMAIYLVAP